MSFIIYHISYIICHLFNYLFIYYTTSPIVSMCLMLFVMYCSRYYVFIVLCLYEGDPHLF